MSKYLKKCEEAEILQAQLDTCVMALRNIARHDDDARKMVLTAEICLLRLGVYEEGLREVRAS